MGADTLYSLIELDSSRCLNVLLQGWKIGLARKEEEGKELRTKVRIEERKKGEGREEERKKESKLSSMMTEGKRG